ncbi:MAG TPA: hypothetical protein VJS64_09575 [Pyrinomonadaceae bacterium]|nr:hypothetical protein [Pyrinomonadaceae bacterium]
MKTLWRLIIVGIIALVIYFATIGRDDFYSVLDLVQNLIQLIADNYLKK